MSTELRRVVRGFARPIDYIIRVNVDNTSETNKREFVSVLNHELMHVFQFLATPVGRELSRIDRYLKAWQCKLLQRVGSSIEIPLLESFQQERREQEDIQFILQLIDSFEKQRAFLSRPWNNTIFKFFAQGNRRWLDIDYIQRKKPITIDIESNSFRLRMPDGAIFEADISGYQVLEAMAKLFQMQVDGRGGGKAFVEECCDAFGLQYNFPMLYLLQEGVTDNPTWEVDTYAILMCCCQIALMMTQDLVSSTGRVPEAECEPGRVFLLLLDQGQALMPWYSIFFLTRPRNWKKLCDQFCEAVGIAPYSELLKAEINAAKYELSRITDPKVAQQARSKITDEAIRLGLATEQPTLPLGHMRRRTTELGIRMLELLWEHPQYIISPLAMFQDHNLPFPPIQYQNGEILVRQDHREVWEFSLLPNVFGMCHLINKILSDSDLSCYFSYDGNDIVYPCSDFVECRNRPRKDTISFCTNPLWRSFVSHVLRDFFGIKHCRSILSRH